MDYVMIVPLLVGCAFFAIGMYFRFLEYKTKKDVEEMKAKYATAQIEQIKNILGSLGVIDVVDLPKH